MQVHLSPLMEETEDAAALLLMQIHADELYREANASALSSCPQEQIFRGETFTYLNCLDCVRSARRCYW